jgi:hypothetical protein
VQLYATLPFTFYFVLVELIVGTALAVLLVEPQLEVGPGFLRFMGVSVLLTVLLALWLASGLEVDGVMRPLYAALAAAALYTIFAYRPRRLPRVAAAAALAATSGWALASGLIGLGPLGYGPAVTASFAAASVAMGASMTGMLLGHWYLVAPMLSSRPLIRLTSLLLFALVAQGAILFWLLGGTDVLGRFGIMVLMRAGFGIVFPLIMGAFVWYSCRIRAMRTATGILYLAVGCVVMGDITAKVLYFLTAVPV